VDAWREGREEGLAEGREKGRAEGLAEQTRLMISEMKSNGIPDEKIAKITRLPIEKVRELLHNV
jgi:predicted transposase/invertase (TIGR01784 family)